MKKEIFLSATLLTLLFSTVMGIHCMSPSQARTWIVDDDEPADFHTINEAISAANHGDTIYVRSGIYYEHVTIDKPLTLMGENRSTTIIDGNGTIYACIHTTPYGVHDVCISGFTIRNGYWGIYIDQNSQANNIDDNIVTDNQCGIHLFRSDSNIITNNVATNNGEGIAIGFSAGNTLVNNTMSSNKYGLDIYGDDLPHFIHNIDLSNKIDGKSVYYLINQHNLMINSTTLSETGYLGLINSTNITVENLNCNGILFAYTNSSTIQNINVSNSVYGIFLAQSFENTISSSLLFKNGCGIKVYSLSSSPTPFCNNTIINNFISDNDCGILLDSAHNNIVNNTITLNKGTDIHLYYCEGNTLKGNHIGGSRYNFEVEGGDLDDFVHDIDTSNTVDGKPLYYWVTQHNMQIPVDAGFVAVVNSTNITVKDLNLTNNSPNVLFAYTRNSTIENITASNSLHSGIELFSSSDNILINNVVLNSECGIDIQGAYNNVTGNFVSLNRGGISLSFAHGNKIDNNLISENEKYGISFWVSYNNTIRCNTVSDNYVGVFLGYQSGYNAIYHNNFINNTEQVRIDDLYKNTWDDGYPSGGNYWSDYAGADLNCDGIGDAPYVINENNQDNYPLIIPWGRALPFWTQWWFWSIIMAGIIVLAGAIYFLKKRKQRTPTAPSLPPERTDISLKVVWCCSAELARKISKQANPL